MRHGIPRCQLDQPGRAEFRQPARIKIDGCPVRIKNLEHLIFIGRGILFYLLDRQRWAGCVSPAWITDHPGEIANQEDNIVAKFLELPHLVNNHGMTDMEVRRSRIESHLYIEWSSQLQFCFETAIRQNFIRSP
jgi:hypothetical protein